MKEFMHSTWIGGTSTVLSILSLRLWVRILWMSMTIFLKFPVGHAIEGQKILKLLNPKNKGKSMPWSITEIHPLLVHFPIALFSTGLLFDISSYVLEKDELETAGFYTMFLGLISGFFAIISGMIVFFEIGSISDIFNFYNVIIKLSSTRATMSSS